MSRPASTSTFLPMLFTRHWPQVLTRVPALSHCRYVSEDSAQRLAGSTKNVAELEAHVAKTVSSIDAKRTDMASKEAEVNQGEARRSSLENNQRWRRIKRRIEETEIELESLPMEEAAESKRDFDVKYDAMQRREREIKSKVWLDDCCTFSHVSPCFCRSLGCLAKLSY